MSGTLVLCGVPIGDVRDASPRLAEILTTADVIAAEDTRRVHRLARALGITMPGRVVSCYDAVEGARAEQLTAHLLSGATVALVTDAGMPGVSDPGFRVVAAAAAAGVRVTVVPGPSAVTAALAVSGLPSDRWTFEGFLPRKGGERRTRLRELATEARTMVFLESPHRLAAGLRDLAVVFGDRRPAVLCRELTKTFEEVVRGDLAALVAWSTDGRVIRGEFTLVVAGGSRRPTEVVAGSGAASEAAVASGSASGIGVGDFADAGPEDAPAGSAASGDAHSGDAASAVPASAVPASAVPASAVPASGDAASGDAGSGDAGSGDPEARGAWPGEAEPAISAAEVAAWGLDQPATIDPAALAGDVERRIAAGMTPKDARRTVAAEHGISRNDVYAAVLAARAARTGGAPRTDR